MQSTLVPRVVRAFVGAALLVIAVPALPAGENYALLVAVGDYDPKQLHKLSYSRNDVVEFHDLLVQSGFRRENVTLMHDDPDRRLPARLFPESAKIRRQLTLMLAGRDEDDTLVLAFAGHGVQFKGEDTSYFCPLDADLEQRETLIPLREIYDAMKACPAKRKLLLVDACRNDPRTAVSRSRMTVDLESITRPQKAPVPESVVAFFSCAAGQQSFEWPELKHGVFFYHVLDVWKNGVDGRKELTLDDLVYQTRKRTESFARNTIEAVQTPEFVGKSAGRWVLRAYDDKVVTNSLGMKLVRIPAGEFLRGTSDAEIAQFQTDNPTAGPGDFTGEQPQHRVRITNDFLMGAHEVTRGQFRRFVESHGYRTEAEKDGTGALGFDLSTGKYEHMPDSKWSRPGFVQSDEHPVVNVSWNDAVAFCDWLSRKEGRTYRLPTEAEWEYACRAGTTTRWSMSDEEIDLKRVANLADASLASKSSSAQIRSWAKNWDDGFPMTAPVGSFQPNRFGLFDMHGNVWEWCSDWYNADEYRQFAGKTAVDPTGSRTGSDRLMRGGSWFQSAQGQRSAIRGSFDPSWILGFRVVAPQ